MSLTVEALAQEIGRIEDGNNLGKTELATALLPFIERHIAAGQQGVGDVESLAHEIGAFHVAAEPENDIHEQWNFTSAELHELARRLATPQPPKPPCSCANCEVCDGVKAIAEFQQPQPADTYSPGDALSLHGAAGRSVSRAPAGVVPLPEVVGHLVYNLYGSHFLKDRANNSTMPFDQLCTINAAIAYGDAREAAWRADAGCPLCFGDCSAANPPVINCPMLAGKEDSPHSDDIAVDRFALAMKAKLAAAREKGYGGWDDDEDLECHLSNLLRQHVMKGDPVDVANFCMFLHQRGETIQPEPLPDFFAAPLPQQPAAEGKAVCPTCAGKCTVLSRVGTESGYDTNEWIPCYDCSPEPAGREAVRDVELAEMLIEQIAPYTTNGGQYIVDSETAPVIVDALRCYTRPSPVAD